MLRPALVLATVAALCLTGCGSGHGTGGRSSSFAQLQITVWPQGESGPSTSYSLGCPGGTGTLPEAAAACAKLSRLGTPAFAPVPPRTACTMIYGGPQVSEVEGTFAGATIDATFSRSNGCEIARWQRLGFLFRLAPVTFPSPVKR
jgi:hypothetical protein